MRPTPTATSVLSSDYTIPTTTANHSQPMTSYSRLIVTTALSRLVSTYDYIFGLEDVLATSGGHTATLTVVTDGFDLGCCIVKTTFLSQGHGADGQTHQSPQPKRNLDPFSRFCRAHDRDRPTDRPTDRRTTLLRLQQQVASTCAVRRCGLKK